MARKSRIAQQTTAIAALPTDGNVKGVAVQQSGRAQQQQADAAFSELYNVPTWLKLAYPHPALTAMRKQQQQHPAQLQFELSKSQELLWKPSYHSNDTLSQLWDSMPQSKSLSQQVKFPSYGTMSSSRNSNPFLSSEWTPEDFWNFVPAGHSQNKAVVVWSPSAKQANESRKESRKQSTAVPAAIRGTNAAPLDVLALHKQARSRKH
ncbi:hypothetical protein RI367_003335 [Sorochytrium milnesiophthora]